MALQNIMRMIHLILIEESLEFQTTTKIRTSPFPVHVVNIMIFVNIEDLQG